MEEFSRSQFPLSLVQEMVYLDQLLHPLSCHLNIGGCLELEGDFLSSLIERALHKLAAKWPSLRAHLVKTDQGVFQRIQEKTNVVFFEKDFIGEADAETKAKKFVGDFFKNPVDMFGSCLWRAAFLRVSSKKSFLVLYFHHVVVDGISTSVILRDLVLIYNDLCGIKGDGIFRGGEYYDFFRDLERYRSGPHYEIDRKFWEAEFLSVPEPVFQYKKENEFISAVHKVKVSRNTYNKLTNFINNEGFSLAGFFVAVVSIFILNCFNKNEIIIGIPLHNRLKAKYKNSVGMFSSVVPLKVELDANEKFSQLLWKITNKLKKIYRHQRFPISEINNIFRRESKYHRRVYDVSVSFEELNTDFEIVGGVYKVSRLEENNSKIPLAISVLDSHREDDVELILNCNLSYMDNSFASKMTKQLGLMINEYVHNFDLSLCQIQIVNDIDRYQLLYEFNDTAAEYPQDQCIHELFEAQVAQRPDAVALVFEGQSLTYEQLNHKANKLAHRLVAEGVKPDSLVGLCVERGLEMVIGLLGILKAGGAYVPIDPSYPAERIEYMLLDSGVSWLLTNRALTRHLPIKDTQRVLCLDEEDTYDGQSTQNLEPAKLGLTPSHLAYVIYTSGSTGQPKGVMIEHGNTFALLSWSRQVYSPEVFSWTLASTSLAFDLSVFEVFAPLSSGGCVVLVRVFSDLHCKSEFKNLTLINTVPSAAQYLVEQGLIPDAVKVINLAGEPLKQRLVDRLYDSKIDHVYDLYGPSEATTYSTFVRRKCNGNETIGRAICNTQVYVLNEQCGLVPLGIVGELYIGGAGLARGYLNRPELTAEKFIANPFYDSTLPGSSERLYKTGDLGRWLPDGNLEFLGRKDHQVKIRGFRIELGEIEAQLRHHELIKDAVVIAHTTESTGNKQLVGYVTSAVVLEEGAELDLSSVRNALKGVLPEYMVPSTLMVLEALPLTANGKIDRKALPAPDGSGLVRTEYVAPQGELEKALAEIWQELLGVERVGLHDNFFDLGGHSLLVMQLLNRINKKYFINLSFRKFFDDSSLIGLTELVVDSQIDIYSESDIYLAEKSINNA